MLAMGSLYSYVQLLNIAHFWKERHFHGLKQRTIFFIENHSLLCPWAARLRYVNDHTLRLLTETFEWSARRRHSIFYDCLRPGAGFFFRRNFFLIFVRISVRVFFPLVTAFQTTHIVMVWARVRRFLRNPYFARSSHDRAAFTMLVVGAQLALWYETCHVMQHYHRHDVDTSLVSLSHVAVALFLYANALANIYRMIRTRVVCDLTALGVAEDSDWPYCERCLCHRPPRTHHCPVCDVCVLKRDHHCWFAGTAKHRCIETLHQPHRRLKCSQPAGVATLTL